MKKLLLALGILYCFSISAQTLLSENFEAATFPSTWTRTTLVTSRPWDLSTVNFSGTTPQAIALRDNFTITGTNSATLDWIASANTANLTSPSFSLVGAASPSLKFNVVVGWSYMINQDLGDLVAQISTDGGLTWTTLWDEDTETGFTNDSDTNPDTDLYNTVAVQKSLVPYIGQANVRIRFQYTATNADAVAIDDVQVLAATLATDEVSRSITSIYPNPTKGEINIKSDKKIKSSEILDFTGKSILKSSSAKADISSLHKGNYIMQVEFTDGTSISEKIIKE